MPVLTPDDIGGPFVCWQVDIPESFVGVVRGLLVELGFTDQWEKFGATDPDECAELFVQIARDFRECVGVTPVGGLTPYTSQIVPPGFLLCDGSQYLRVDYPQLYDVLDAAFIVDPDNFIVPDLRRRQVIGANPAFPFASTGGQIERTINVANLPDHNSEIETELRNFRAGPIAIENFENMGSLTRIGGSFDGNNNPLPTMDPYLSLIWLIRAS